MSENDTNRVTDPIDTQEEADGLRTSLAERKSLPPSEMTPVQEEAIAVDEARLAQWDAAEHVEPMPETESVDGEEETADA